MWMWGSNGIKAGSAMRSTMVCIEIQQYNIEHIFTSR